MKSNILYIYNLLYIMIFITCIMEILIRYLWNGIKYSSIPFNPILYLLNILLYFIHKYKLKKYKLKAEYDKPKNNEIIYFL